MYQRQSTIADRRAAGPPPLLVQCAPRLGGIALGLNIRAVGSRALSEHGGGFCLVERDFVHQLPKLAQRCLGQHTASLVVLRGIERIGPAHQQT